MIRLRTTGGQPASPLPPYPALTARDMRRTPAQREADHEADHDEAAQAGDEAAIAALRLIEEAPAGKRRRLKADDEAAEEVRRVGS